MKCRVDDCEKKAEKRGWCGMHYRRWQRHGNPHTIKKGLSIPVKPTKSGYIRRSRDSAMKLEHVFIVEKILGYELPTGVQVHHFDGDGTNNSNHNLVVCPSQEYHSLLHCRQRAFASCGNADWRPCAYCRIYSALDDLIPHKKSWAHRDCKNTYLRERYHAIKNGTWEGRK